MRAIMAARKILLCLIFLVICFPIFVDEDVSLPKRFFVNTTITTSLVEFQINSHLWFGFICDGIFIAMIVSLFLFICYQLIDIHRKDHDIDHMDGLAKRTNEKVEEVLEFYKEMEDLFASLETRSNSLKHASDLEKETEFDMQLVLPLKVEIDELKEKWHRQQNVFARYGIELEGSAHTRESIAAELFVAGAFAGNQIKRIEQDIAEDTLSLRAVQRDARILKVYFGK